MDTVFTTAVVYSLNSRTGRKAELPVLSAAIPRAEITQLDFSQLDPSDAIENFRYRGDFKASRKSEAFQPIAPLTPDDITTVSADDMSFLELLAHIETARQEFKAKIAELSLSANFANPLPDPIP